MAGCSGTDRLVDPRRRYATARHVTLWTEAERLIFDLPGVRVIASTPYRTELEVTAQQTTLGEVVDAAMHQGAIRTSPSRTARSTRSSVRSMRARKKKEPVA